MPGVIELRRNVPIGIAIADLFYIAQVSTEEDWDNKIAYLPLR